MPSPVKPWIRGAWLQPGPPSIRSSWSRVAHHGAVSIWTPLTASPPPPGSLHCEKHRWPAGTSFGEGVGLPSRCCPQHQSGLPLDPGATPRTSGGSQDHGGERPQLPQATRAPAKQVGSHEAQGPGSKWLGALGEEPGPCGLSLGETPPCSLGEGLG